MGKSNRKGYIYLITNTVTGKVYIGQTIQTLRIRFNQHKYAARHGTQSKLYHSMRKHGVENFTITPLEEMYIEDTQNLGDAEIRYIEKYNAVQDGYNIAEGGKVPWNSGQTKETNETLARMSEARKGSGNPMWGRKVERSEQWRIRQSQSKSGSNNPMWGKTVVHSEEIKAAIGRANLGSKNGMYGKSYKMDEERKQNISEAKIKKYEKRKTKYLIKDTFTKGTNKKVVCQCTECGKMRTCNKYIFEQSDGRLVCECK